MRERERERLSKKEATASLFWERERFGTGWFVLKIASHMYIVVGKSGVSSNTYCTLMPLVFN